MGLKISTGMRNAILARRASGVAFLQGIKLALVDGGTGEDTITHSDSGFLAAGFEPGMSLYLVGCTTAGNDAAVSLVKPTAVVAGTMNLPTGTVATAETFLATSTLIGIRGGSLADLFMNCVARVYSGSQPADADAAETGSHLLTITASSGAFVAGAPGNGLLWADTCVTAGEITKLLSQVWSGVGLAAGTAGWIRFYDNAYTTGSSTSAIRFDANISTTSYPVKMSNTSVTVGATSTIDACKVILPAS